MRSLDKAIGAIVGLVGLAVFAAVAGIVWLTPPMARGRLPMSRLTRRPL